jgi:hypothetical protein
MDDIDTVDRELVETGRIVPIAAAEIGGEEEERARGGELGDKGVSRRRGIVKRRLIAGKSGKIGGLGVAGDQGVALVHVHGQTPVDAGAPEVGGVVERDDVGGVAGVAFPSPHRRTSGGDDRDRSQAVEEEAGEENAVKNAGASLIHNRLSRPAAISTCAGISGR